jgi:GTPase
LENLTKVILVAYPDRFRLEEAKSLVESLQNEIVKVFTQKYLDRAEFGMGSGKAEAIKNFCEGISC